MTRIQYFVFIVSISCQIQIRNNKIDFVSCSNFLVNTRQKIRNRNSAWLPIPQFIYCGLLKQYEIDSRGTRNYCLVTEQREPGDIQSVSWEGGQGNLAERGLLVSFERSTHRKLALSIKQCIMSSLCRGDWGRELESGKISRPEFIDII